VGRPLKFSAKSFDDRWTYQGQLLLPPPSSRGVLGREGGEKGKGRGEVEVKMEGKVEAFDSRFSSKRTFYFVNVRLLLFVFFSFISLLFMLGPSGGRE